MSARPARNASRRIAGFLAIALGFSGSAAEAVEETINSLAVAPVDFPFDVSRSNSAVDREFGIDECRSYIVGIRFDYFGSVDLYHVLKLVGQGEGWSGGSKGVIVPIHLKLLDLDDLTGIPRPVYEGISETKLWYAHGLSEIPENGWYERRIMTKPLGRGRYRVQANTLKDSPEFSGTPSHLVITYRANVVYPTNYCAP